MTSLSSEEIDVQLRRAFLALIARAKDVVVVRVYETERVGELAKISSTGAALVKPGLVAGGYSEAFQKYGVRATPTLFLIDPIGKLRYVDVNADGFEALVGELLKK